MKAKCEKNALAANRYLFHFYFYVESISIASKTKLFCWQLKEMPEERKESNESATTSNNIPF